MRQQLVEWLYAAALAFASPEKLVQFPGHEETLEERKARYHEIAEDIESTGASKNEAALMLAWAIGETGLSRDADKGPCFQGKQVLESGLVISWKGRCDSGAAAGLWQTHAFYHQGEEITVEDLFSDRRGAARHVLRFMRASWKACASLPLEDRMSQFGLGRCLTQRDVEDFPSLKQGLTQVRKRYALWTKVRGFKVPEKKENAWESSTFSSTPTSSRASTSASIASSARSSSSGWTEDHGSLLDTAWRRPSPFTRCFRP